MDPRHGLVVKLQLLMGDPVWTGDSVSEKNQVPDYVQKVIDLERSNSLMSPASSSLFRISRGRIPILMSQFIKYARDKWAL